MALATVPTAVPEGTYTWPRGRPAADPLRLHGGQASVADAGRLRPHGQLRLHPHRGRTHWSRWQDSAYGACPSPRATRSADGAWVSRSGYDPCSTLPSTRDRVLDFLGGGSSTSRGPRCDAAGNAYIGGTRLIRFRRWPPISLRLAAGRRSWPSSSRRPPCTHLPGAATVWGWARLTPLATPTHRATVRGLPHGSALPPRTPEAGMRSRQDRPHGAAPSTPPPRGQRQETTSTPDPGTIAVDKAAPLLNRNTHRRLPIQCLFPPVREDPSTPSSPSQRHGSALVYSTFLEARSEARRFWAVAVDDTARPSSRGTRLYDFPTANRPAVCSELRGLWTSS